MKRNGFTLIELLAVIVILAIIALIAVPIILNIIDDADEKSEQRSIELYASAVKNAIAAYRLNNTVAPEKFSDLTVEYDGNVKCKTQILYPDKTIYLAGCTVNNGEKEYSYGVQKLEKVCKYVGTQSSLKYSLGAEYECSLGGETLKFYLLQDGDNTTFTKWNGEWYTGGTDEYPAYGTTVKNEIALILERNYDNTTQPWCDQSGPNPNNNICNGDGLEDKLNEIRGNWSNELNSEQIGLPTYDQISQAHTPALDWSIEPWLSNYLDFDATTATPYGYYTSAADCCGMTWSVSYSNGKAYFADLYSINNTTGYGVRPVITISKDQLK